MKYELKWVAEAGWVILVAVVVQAGQLLQASSAEEVMTDPEAWALTFLGALARVAYASGKNFILVRLRR